MEIMKRVLTVRHSFRILVELYAVFVSLSAGQGGLLFDNRYDVPESVRNYSSFSSTNSLSLSSDNNSLGQAGSDANRSIFFVQATSFKREFDPGSERTLAACLTHASRVRACSNTGGARRTGA